MTNKEYEIMLQNMTGDQKEAFEAVMSGANVFVSGGGGVGKSFVLRLIVYALEIAGKNVMTCAPTGVAASNIEGVTIHRAFRLPLGPCITEKTVKIMAHAPKALQITDVVVIDEVSMCRIDVFDSIVASIEKAERTSGNHIQLVVFGDYYQLPPVIPDNGERDFLSRYYGEDIRGGYAFLSPGWHRMKFSVVELNEVVRQKDPEFAGNLNRLRIGDVSVLDYFNAKSAKEPIEGGVSLYPCNRQVSKANAEGLQMIDEPPIHLETLYDGELSASDCAGGADVLTIKPWARIMFTANDNGKTATTLELPGKKRCYPKKEGLRYVNGSMGTVYAYQDDPDDPYNGILVIGVDGGEIVEVSRQRYAEYEYVTKGDKLVRRVVGHYYRFPICLAYALTIHKSQGQSYNRVNIDPACYNHGQLYVALSRCREIGNMYLMGLLQPEYLIIDPDVKDFYAHVNNAGRGGCKIGCLFSE